MYYLGFDIGGSSVKAVLVKDRKILKSSVYDLPGTFEDLVRLILKMKDELVMSLGMDGVKGAGFGIAGALNKTREIMLNSPNISYLNNQPLKKIFEEKLAPYPVKIEHDVKCFLLAETKIGLAKDLKNVFYLTLGTGIGGAWMVNGEIFYGAHGSAGEGGHMIIDKDKGLNLDELEELAANKFIVRSLGFGSIEAIKRAQAGDEKVKKVFLELGRNLGIGLANIINIFDPEAVIISGGVADAKEFMLPGIREGIEKNVLSPEAQKTQILFSALGRFGGALGAALMFE